MSFYEQSDGHSSQNFSRTFTEEVAVAFSAIDCVLNGEKAVYASSELTSGLRLNRLLVQNGASRSSELRARLGENEYRLRVWNPNVEAATAFARNLHHTLGGNQLVISPAPFMAPGWTQHQYLSFWEELLRTRIKSVYFNEGWQHSNGCTFEFAVAVDAGLPTYTSDGRPLSADEGARLIRDAVAACRAQGLEPEALVEHLGRVLKLLPTAHSRDT